jgi:hypothetical protein
MRQADRGYTRFNKPIKITLGGPARQKRALQTNVPYCGIEMEAFANICGRGCAIG